MHYWSIRWVGGSLVDDYVTVWVNGVEVLRVDSLNEDYVTNMEGLVKGVTPAIATMGFKAHTAAFYHSEGDSSS
jgi:hypothetical protein